jgi:uncharacterized coiled-coil protein SlyX
MDAFSHDLLQITTETSDSNTIVTENLLNRIERLEKRLAVQELYVDEIVDNVENMAAQMLDSFKQIETKIIAINRRFIRFFCYVMRQMAEGLKWEWWRKLSFEKHSIDVRRDCNYIHRISEAKSDENILGIKIPINNPRIFQGCNIQEGDLIRSGSGQYDGSRKATLEEVTRWKAEEQEFFESMV